jgi:hypothetical protein
MNVRLPERESAGTSRQDGNLSPAECFSKPQNFYCAPKSSSESNDIVKKRDAPGRPQIGEFLNPQMAMRLKKIGCRGAPKFVRREVTGINERDKSWTYRRASIPARYSHENILPAAEVPTGSTPKYFYGLHTSEPGDSLSPPASWPAQINQ